jgi:hypothetical protein
VDWSRCLALGQCLDCGGRRGRAPQSDMMDAVR